MNREESKKYCVKLLKSFIEEKLNGDINNICKFDLVKIDKDYKFGKPKDYFMERWKDGLKSENVLVRYKAKQFIKIIEKVGPIKEFNVDLFFMFIEKMTLFEREKIIVSLLDETEIEVVIE